MKSQVLWHIFSLASKSDEEKFLPQENQNFRSDMRLFLEFFLVHEMPLFRGILSYQQHMDSDLQPLLCRQQKGSLLKCGAKNSFRSFPSWLFLSGMPFRVSALLTLQVKWNKKIQTEATKLSNSAFLIYLSVFKPAHHHGIQAPFFTFQCFQKGQAMVRP